MFLQCCISTLLHFRIAVFAALLHFRIAAFAALLLFRIAAFAALLHFRIAAFAALLRCTFLHLCAYLRITQYEDILLFSRYAQVRSICFFTASGAGAPVMVRRLTQERILMAS